MTKNQKALVDMWLVFQGVDYVNIDWDAWWSRGTKEDNIDILMRGTLDRLGVLR